MKKSKIFRAAILLFAFLLLFFILNKIGFEKILSSLKQIAPTYLIAAVLLQVLFFVVYNWQQNIFLNEIAQAKFFGTFPILMAGFFGNTVTPGVRAGGEPIKAYFYAKKYCGRGKDGRASRFLAPALITQIINTIAFLITVLASIVLAFFVFPIPNSIARVLEAIFLVVLFLILVPYGLSKLTTLRKISNKTIYRFRFLFKEKTFPRFKRAVLERVDIFSKTFSRLVRKKKKGKLVLAFILAFVPLILTYLKVYILLLALDYRINFLVVFVAVTLSTFLSALLFVPGGIGLTESFLIFLFWTHGIVAEAAATVVVLEMLIYYAFALGLGYLSLVYLSWRYR